MEAVGENLLGKQEHHFFLRHKESESRGAVMPGREEVIWGKQNLPGRDSPVVRGLPGSLR